jgi:hypothetical protein
VQGINNAEIEGPGLVQGFQRWGFCCYRALKSP